MNVDNLNEIVWQANDMLIVLGLSGNQHPLALLESIVTSKGAAFYTCPGEITFIAQHIGHRLTDKAYEVKFDLRANREQNKSFVRPLDNFALGSLNLLGLILMTTIEAHCTLKNAQLYTASAAYKSLTSFYRGLQNATLVS